MEIKPIHILAIIIIIGCFILIGLGKDGQIKLLLGAVVGYFFRSVEVTVKNEVAKRA